jgi:hypothetical protein
MSANDDDETDNAMSAFGIASRLKSMSKEKQDAALTYEPKSGTLAPYSKTRWGAVQPLNSVVTHSACESAWE